MIQERWIQKKSFVWLVFLLGLLMTVYVGYLVNNVLERKQKDQFDYVCNQVTLQIQERLVAYQLILQGGAAFFAGSDMVSRKAWHDYVQTLLFDMPVPGIQGIGYAQVLIPEQLSAHIAGIRKEGFPDYRVHPEGQRNLYTAIIYLEPFRDRNLRAFGYDMYTESIRRTAMERARDTGNLSLSGKVKLVQDTDADKIDTLMYIPIYKKGAVLTSVDQKRAALLGWVYSPFRLQDFMFGILGHGLDQQVRDVRLSIYAGRQVSADNVLFNSDPELQLTDIQYLPNQQKIINFGGQRWTLDFYNHTLRHGLYFLPLWVTLVIGLVLSTLLSLLMNTIRNTKIKALCLEDELSWDVKYQKALLVRRAHYDVLTDLPNRVLFNDRLEQGMAQMRRQKQMLALVYIDLDGFKAINDTYGHHAGDQVLSTVAKSMKKSLREVDTLARLGGDEFVVILLGKGDIKALKAIVIRLLEAVMMPTEYGAVMLQVTASIGVALCTQTDSLSMEDLICRADKAMYVSKHKGKNCYHFFDVIQDEQVERVK